MSKDRLDLQLILEKLIGNRNVYFQPPESLKLKYPCIVYEKSKIDKQYADNYMYLRNNLYSITVIYQDPDSELPDKVLNLPYCSFDRHFVADNLYHDVFELYF